MSSSAGYTIQAHSFYFLFPSCIVEILENKTNSMHFAILSWTRNTSFYILHRQLIRMSNPPSSILVIELVTTLPCDVMHKRNSQLPKGMSGNNDNNNIKY